jgi:hypothetical protein
MSEPKPWDLLTAVEIERALVAARPDLPLEVVQHRVKLYVRLRKHDSDTTQPPPRDLIDAFKADCGYDLESRST